MKNNFFKEKDALLVYTKYMQEVEKLAFSLSKSDKIELMNEIDSHIYESFQDNKHIESEKERIGTVLENLGTPKIYLRPMIAEMRLKNAVKRYHLWGILKGFWNLVLTGGKYLALYSVYLIVLASGVIVISKLLLPNNTGLFVNNDSVYFGFMSNINSEATELLGYWLIPIMIIAVIAFYYLITYLLKRIIN